MGSTCRERENKAIEGGRAGPADEGKQAGPCAPNAGSGPELCRAPGRKQANRAVRPAGPPGPARCRG
ncbi:hypothetical protein GCM10022406_04110 [Hymenobacter algoricola]|uniref:Uncharacterized protein n=1 Tax=Hymenobacter algoricola TaxID=486267 RepID=A0ABP7ME84_9BACT